ncbi:hypothetical protein C9I89_16630 [Photobacterium lipolyticum]|uniref:Outer membrane protein beta-barrel domain-containing protein n=1 Tax=Photobacterium lipolyticum TaxID=266810 RepID=A0A2T3MV15_9GAMM|nr:hypothetical protein C9I89_16630 [Photobacterium lipolyticum]
MGYTFSNQIKDENGIKIQPGNDPHFAMAVETNVEPGRVGLFLSHQATEMKGIEGDGSFTYLHFQSSLRYEAKTKLGAFFGASLGASFVDADWSENSVLFSGGLFGGAEYRVHKNAKIVFEGRWLANFIDSHTTAICHLPAGNQTCHIIVDSKILSQVQTNIGVSFSF